MALLLPLAAGWVTTATLATTVTASEQDASPISADVLDLKQQLEKGLKARRPSEFAFINLVVAMVENDSLPMDLVKSTFLWARKKGLSTRYPFPYFERALRIRAAKQGITIP